MKLTKRYVAEVQRDIDEYGLEVALYNVLWRQAVEQLGSIGVKRVRTEDYPVKKKAA